METAIEEKKAVAGEEKKKRTWWDVFVNFLAMGGFLVLLVVGAALAILISRLFK